MLILKVVTMVSNDVKQAISDWTAWAATPGVGRYDIALLKIWIQFERFLGSIFVAYATGKPSETGYVPKLKIKFLDEEHFNVFMREGNKKYVEYLDKIEKLSAHVFKDNPFDIILLDANIKPAFDQMKALRNYIAHESGEAKRKVTNTCFSGNVKHFLEPNAYLLSREPTTRSTYYTYYTTIIGDVVDLLISDPNGTV